MKRGNTMPVLINCAICRKPVATPKTLTCMHQFCSKCLAKPSAWGGNSGVTCPKCGLFTEQKDIRCDSLPPLTRTPEPSGSARNSISRNSVPEVGVSPTQTEHNDSPRDNQSQCQICEEGRIAFKCVTCEMFMCVHCQKSHKRIPVTLDHVIQDVKSIANEKLLSLKEDIARHEAYKDEVQQRLDLYEKYKKYLLTLQVDIFDEIERAALTAKNKLQKRIDREAGMGKDMVQKAITKELKSLELSRISLTDQLEQSKQMTSSLMATVASRDEMKMATNGIDQSDTDMANLIQGLARDQLKTKLEIMVVPRDFEDDPPDLRVNLCDVDISRGDIKLLYPSEEPCNTSDQSQPSNGFTSKPPMVPQKKGAGKPKSLLPLRVAKQKTQPMIEPRMDTPIPQIEENKTPVPDEEQLTGPNRVCSKSLRGITQLKWTSKEQIAIPNTCDTFAIVNGKFWCVSRMRHTIAVLSADGQVLSTISDPTMKHPTSLTTCGDHSVMVSCTSGYGLLEINQQGDFKQVVANGSFSDVSFNNGTITAIECEPCRIVTFRKGPDNESWVCQDEIELDFMTGSQNDNAIFCTEQYFVSSIKNKCVFIYGENGEVLNTYRAFLPGGLGAWHLCRLAMVDREGTMLIVDQSNHRILVLDKENHGEFLKIDTGLQVIDVVIDERGFMFALDAQGAITRYQSDLPLPVVE